MARSRRTPRRWKRLLANRPKMRPARTSPSPRKRRRGAAQANASIAGRTGYLVSSTMIERLQKIIARSGIASRRHAEELIRAGQVRVNGVVVTELGAKADPERDKVEAAGRVAERPTELSYFILNKPAHVVATMSDPEGRGTIRHLLRGLSNGVFPVGRLEYAASGLVLLSNDGELADQFFKHSARMPKVYWMKLKGRPSEETLRLVRHRALVKLRPLRGPGAAPGFSANPWYEVELGDARHDALRDALLEMGHPVE